MATDVASAVSALEVLESAPLEGLAERCEEQLTKLASLVGSAHADQASKFSLDVMADILLACASHCGKHYWSTEPSRKQAKEVIAALVHSSNSNSVAELLSRESGRLMKYIVPKLKAKLTRDSWKQHPSAKQAMVWCLKRLHHPSVAPHLDFFLPACLLLLDDHESQNKVLGLSAAKHIISNVDASELRWYGRAQVLYQAMKPMLYSGEAGVTGALHPTLLLLLPVVDGSQSMHRTEQKHASEVFAILLSSLDMEAKVAMRKAYIAHVRGYIQLLGINTARHMKIVVRVLCSCLEFPDYSGEHTRRDTLAALASLMQHIWPRIPCHKQTLLKALLQLVSDLYPQPSQSEVSSDNQKLLGPLVECLVLLAQCCDDIKACYEDLCAQESHDGLRSCLTQALTKLQKS